MSISKWLKTLLSEKGIELDQVMQVPGASGVNFIPVQFVFDMIGKTSQAEQSAIKATLVKIDYQNGDVLHFLKHLAQAIAV